MITNVLWDESHALLMVYLSVPLQCYGICRSWVYFAGRGRQAFELHQERIWMLYCGVPISCWFFHLATWPGALQYIFLQNAVDKYWIQSTRFSCWQCRCIFLYTLSWSLDANCCWEWSNGAFLKSELILHHKAAVHKDLVILAMQSAVFSVVMTRIPGY